MKNARGEKGRAPPKDVDTYLARLPADVRATLERLRADIRSVVSGGEEVISYQMPTFRYLGGLVAYAAHPGHCSFYLMSHTAMAAHERDLEKYDTSGVTIRFAPGRPLPRALVRKLVKTRMKENEAHEKSKRARSASRSRRKST